MLKKLVAFVFPALVLVAQAPTASADSSTGTLFGITGFGQSVLSRIDPTTGVVTDIEDLAGPEQGQLVNVTGDPLAHRIYALRQSVIFTPPSTISIHNQLLTINSDNGSVTAGAVGAVGNGQLVFDDSSGLLYQLNFGGRISTIDPLSGKSTLKATVPVSPSDTLSMAVGPGASTIYIGQGTFDYETGGESYDVITLNTATGEASTSPINPGRLGFLMYDNSSGLLLTSDTQNLYSVDPLSGAETVITNYSNGPQGLFFFDGAVDPSTNTVYLHLNAFDFVNPIDQIVTISEQTGAFTLSASNITTSQLESMYFMRLVTVTPDSLSGDVRSSLTSGQITKASVANTLLSDLNAAQAARNRGQCKTAANIYQQFMNDVAAQTGKSIALATASRLTREAENLQGSCP